MDEYLEKWEAYVADHYSPEDMTRCKLEELYKIADVMKDMAEYWTARQGMMMGE